MIHLDAGIAFSAELSHIHKFNKALEWAATATIRLHVANHCWIKNGAIVAGIRVWRSAYDALIA